MKKTLWIIVSHLFKLFTDTAPIIVFCRNLIIATLVVVILHAFDDTAFFKENRDYVLDHIMYWHSDYGADTHKTNIQRLALFNIDDKAYRAWGALLITPRDKLKTLIEKAVNGGANVIIVDIDFAWHTDASLFKPNNPLSIADKRLGIYLQKLNQDPNAPIIILNRLYRYPLNNQGKIDTAQFLQKTPSFLDSYIKQQKNVFWASAFYKPDSDYVLRRWEIISLICDDNQLNAVPSMQLMAALAQQYTRTQNHQIAAQALQNYQQQLSQWAKNTNCENAMTLQKLCQTKNCEQLDVILPFVEKYQSNFEIKIASSHTSQKVFYRFAPDEVPNFHRKSLIDNYRALDVINDEIDVMGQIVLIGTTHKENGDKHFIPIRGQPVDGVYIIANAIDTLMQFGQLQPENCKFIFSLIIILISTLIFTYLHSLIAFLLTFVILISLFLYSFTKM
ncbi:MAG: CHASE2 domain-containing protein [Thiotrichaceae bacterium]|nr:CHASE2 domain-containing protein [Thiotrichaceae bacterium]